MALSPKWELADEGKPGQQPGGELLGKDRPIVRLPSAAAPLNACLISQGNGICGVVDSSTKVVGSSFGGVTIPEIHQALCEVGGSDGEEEER